MALEYLLGATQSFTNYLRAMREGRMDQIAQSGQEMDRFLNTYNNLQQSKLAKERMKYAEEENLRASALFKPQLRSAEAQAGTAELNLQNAQRKSEIDQKMADFLGGELKKNGIDIGPIDDPEKMYNAMVIFSKIKQEIPQAQAKTEKKTLESQGQVAETTGMKAEAEQPYIERGAQTDIETKEAALDNLRADTSLKNANAALAQIKKMQDEGMLTSPDEMKAALVKMGFDPAFVDAMKYAIDAKIMPEVTDLLMQFKVLSEWKVKLLTEKPRVIDPMDYFVFQDDPDMDKYLKESMQGMTDPTQVLRDINDQIDGIKGQLLRYKFDIDASMKGYRSRGPLTPDDLNQQTGNYGTQTGATTTPPPLSTELPEDVSQTTVGQMISQYGVDPYEALAIAKWESGGAFDNSIRGTSGEYGIMQIMPATGEGMGYSIEDLQDPATNFEAGLKYLSKFAGDTPEERIQQYNAGPGDKSPNYLNSILGYINEYKQNPELFRRDLALLEKAINPQPSQAKDIEIVKPTTEPESKQVPPEGTLGPGIEQAKSRIEAERKKVGSIVRDQRAVDAIISLRQKGYSYKQILDKVNKGGQLYDAIQRAYGETTHNSIIQALREMEKYR